MDQISVNHIAEFLIVQKNSGISHSQVRCYMSALSAILPKFNNKPLVEHEVIQRVLKASYRANPPRARYSFTWDVEPLLTAWDIANDSLTLMDLSLKTFTFFAIATMGRGSDLRATSVKEGKIIP